MAREPGYRLHKPTGQGYVRLNGKVFYLGEFNSPRSLEKYARLKSEWLVNKNGTKFTETLNGPVIASVCLSYFDHAEEYYGAGTELANLKLAIRPLSELYATLPTSLFGPLEYKSVRQWWLDRETNRKAGKVSRQYVNAQVKRLVRIVKWGVSEGMILSRYLLRGADQRCFSPREAMNQRRRVKHDARTTPLSCGNKPGSNVKTNPKKQPRDFYDTASYGRAIRYVCDKAFPAPEKIKKDAVKLKEWRTAHHWAPNRLRHTRGTEVRKQFGLEAASSTLGHAEISVTQIYAEQDQERAINVARSIG